MKTAMKKAKELSNLPSCHTYLPLLSIGFIHKFVSVHQLKIFHKLLDFNEFRDEVLVSIKQL